MLGRILSFSNIQTTRLGWFGVLCFCLLSSSWVQAHLIFDTNNIEEYQQILDLFSGTTLPEDSAVNLTTTTPFAVGSNPLGIQVDSPFHETFWMMVFPITKPKKGIRIVPKAYNCNCATPYRNKRDCSIAQISKILGPLKIPYLDLIVLPDEDMTAGYPLVVLEYNNHRYHIVMDRILPTKHTFYKVGDYMGKQILRSTWLDHILSRQLSDMLYGLFYDQVGCVPFLLKKPGDGHTHLLQEQRRHSYYRYSSIEQAPDKYTIAIPKTAIKIFPDKLPYYFSLFLRKSSLPGCSGLGVFTAEAVKAGDYLGMIIGKSEMHTKGMAFGTIKDTHRILINLPKCKKDLILAPQKNNAFRWLNMAYNMEAPKFSPEPNVTLTTCGLVKIPGIPADKPVTMVKACRDISPNRELLFSYDTLKENVVEPVRTARNPTQQTLSILPVPLTMKLRKQ